MSHSFSDITQWSYTDLGVVTGSGTSPVRVAAVAGNFFDTLGVSPKLGRPIDHNDDQPGHEHVAVISDRLWRTYFAADANVAAGIYVWAGKNIRYWASWRIGFSIRA